MTREEAIKNIKLFFTGINIALSNKTKEALDVLIPELADSEDERIRKGLIEALKTSKTVGELKFILPESTREECIAYLEKQKEKEIPKWMPKFLDELRSKKHYFDWDEHRDIEGSILAIIDFIAPDYFTEKDKKEQKPDKCKGCAMFLSGECTHPNGKCKNAKPKQEWSEEDEEALDMCLDAIPKAWKTKSGILLTKWLKDNIHLQSKQEWSEEDEKMLNNLIWAVHMKSISPCDEMDDRNVYEKYESFLKSLRPSWKPSEEQMKQLENAMMLPEFGPMVTTKKQYPALESLYKQLKKLI